MPVLFQYQAKADPVRPAGPERTTPDKWHPEIQRPRFDVARNQSIYPTLANPVSPNFLERITVDKWFQEAQRSLLPVRPARFAYPYRFGPEVVIASTTVGMDSWWQESFNPDHRPVRSVAYPFLSVLLPGYWTGAPPRPSWAESVSADKWHPSIEQPQFDLRRVQFLYQLFVSPDRQPQPNLGAWLTEIKPPQFDVVRRQFGYPSLAFGQFQFAENTSPDKWYPRFDDRLFDLGRAQFLYPHSFSEPLPRPAPVFLDSWWQMPNAPLFDLLRRQWTYPTESPRPVSTTFPERITLDKWQPSYNDLNFDLGRVQFVYPSLSFAEAQFAETTSIDRWFERPSLPQAKPGFLWWMLGSTDSVHIPEFIGPDKWAQFSDPQRSMIWIWYALESLARSYFTESEIITPDKWHPLIQLPLFDLLRLQSLYPSEWIVPPAICIPAWGPIVPAGPGKTISTGPYVGLATHLST